MLSADRTSSEKESPSQGPTLVVEDLTVGYGTSPVVQGVSVRARPGELTAIVGPNGAGKSTLLKGIAGVLRTSGGRTLLGDDDVTNLSPERLIRRGISYVPQVANVFPSLTVRENLEMGWYIRRGEAKSRIDELCAMFPDLRDSLNRQARTLSGGQRMMLALGRGLMVHPKVLLLDEPTAGLAPKVVDLVWAHVLEIKASGPAVLVVEQNTRRSLRDADWGYVLANGVNNLEGPGPELLEDSNLVRLYIGG
ncbi:MAG: ABC transporter ATP-binding protein [Acidimicrobiales bacterium]